MHGSVALLLWNNYTRVHKINTVSARLARWFLFVFLYCMLLFCSGLCFLFVATVDMSIPIGMILVKMIL